MTGFDLLFLAGVLLTAAVLAGAALLTLTGHGRRAGRWLRRAGVIWAVYLAAAFLIAALSQPRTFAAGEPQCFDDICFAVTGAAWKSDRLAVTVHISNNARRVTEGEGGMRGAQLWANGRLYEASGGALPLSVRLPPGASANSVQLFPLPPATGGSLEMPRAERASPAANRSPPSSDQRERPSERWRATRGDFSDVALVLNHGTSAWFIIGEGTLFHGPVLMRLPAVSPAALRK